MTIKKDERALLQQISLGDEKAFSVLFYSYLPLLEKFVLRFAKSAHATEEIIQEVFLKIWLNRDKLSEVENIKAYLYKYTSNECLSYLRKSLRAEKHLDVFTGNYVAWNNSTQESVHYNDLKKFIAIAVANLSPQRRKVYELSRNDHKSIQEIAQLLNISENTVKNVLVTVLKSIRGHLEKNGILLSVLVCLIRLK